MEDIRRQRVDPPPYVQRTHNMSWTIFRPWFCLNCFSCYYCSILASKVQRKRRDHLHLANMTPRIQTSSPPAHTFTHTHTHTHRQTHANKHSHAHTCTQTLLCGMWKQHALTVGGWVVTSCWKYLLGNCLLRFYFWSVYNLWVMWCFWRYCIVRGHSPKTASCLAGIGWSKIVWKIL